MSNKPEPTPAAKPTYMERVITEKEELDEKVEKLTEFLSPGKEGGIEITEAERDRLQRQLDCMVAYSTILVERIEAFGTQSDA